MNVKGDSQLKTLTTSGDTTVTGILNVKGDSQLKTLTTSGNTSVGGTLSVTEESQLATLKTSGDTTVGGILTVAVKSNLNSLETTGDIIVGGKLSVTDIITTSADINPKEDSITVPTTKWTNAAINSAISSPSSIPIGGIIMWNSINVPENWKICDGNIYNDIQTPNLIDKFVVGAGTTYPVGSTGGKAQVTLGIDEIPSHTHDFKYTAVQGASHNANGQQGSQQACYRAQSVTNSGTTSSTGGNGSHENLPPYYALYYIMRIK